MSEDRKWNSSVDVCRPFDTDDDAIRHAQKIARNLGQREFAGGLVVKVLGESGEVVAEIPVQRLHS